MGSFPGPVRQSLCLLSFAEVQANLCSLFSFSSNNPLKWCAGENPERYLSAFMQGSICPGLILRIPTPVYAGKPLQVAIRVPW
jgi:hypothetical protein